MRTLSGVTRTGVSADAPDVSRDDGVILVWVALMLVVLVGMGALVIDIGALYVERRELQNGADAAALAVAQDCVEGDCGSGGGSTRAQQYADLNANDGVSALDPSTPCGVGPGLTACTGSAPAGASGATGWVRVGTSTKTADGGDEVSFLLAPVISSLTGKTVNASAVAAWGSLQGATTLPFTFSVCEFWNLLPAGATENAAFPDNTVIVYSKAGGGPNNEIVPACESRSSSGGTVEGGFGWLDPSGASCSVQLDVGDTITGPGDPGNDNLLKKAPCSETLIQGKTVLLPLFASVEGTGSNATYTIVGLHGVHDHGLSTVGIDVAIRILLSAGARRDRRGRQSSLLPRHVHSLLLQRRRVRRILRLRRTRHQDGRLTDVGRHVSPSKKTTFNSRRKDMNRRIVGITLAVLLGVAGTFVLARYVQSARDEAAEPEPTATVLIVSGDLPLGASLDDVAARVESTEVPERLVADGALDDLDGLDPELVVGVELQAGEQLLRSRLVEPGELVSVDVPAGLQEITIALDPERLPSAASSKLEPRSAS